MRRISLALLAVVLALATAVAEGKETVTVGGAVVPVADGWKSTTVDGRTVLVPTDLPDGVVCSFTLMGGEPLDVPVKDKLAADWAALAGAGSMTGDNGGKVDRVDGPDGLVEFASRAATLGADGLSVHVWLIIASAHGRGEKMMVVASTPEAFKKYSPAVATMLEQTRFIQPKKAGAARAATAPPPAAPAAAAPGDAPKWDGKPAAPLQGVCFGSAQVKTRTDRECWIFLPNGVVFNGFPLGGPAHWDVDAERKRNPKDFGTYHTEGSDVVVTMPNEKEPVRFVQSKGAWAATVTRPFQDRRTRAGGFAVTTWTEQVPSPLRITRVASCNGLKLDATYRLDPNESYAPDTLPAIRFTAAGGSTRTGSCGSPPPPRHAATATASRPPAPPPAATGRTRSRATRSTSSTPTARRRAECSSSRTTSWPSPCRTRCSWVPGSC